MAEKNTIDSLPQRPPLLCVQISKNIYGTLRGRDGREEKMIPCLYVPYAFNTNFYFFCTLRVQKNDALPQRPPHLCVQTAFPDLASSASLRACFKKSSYTHTLPILLLPLLL
jgi:hypothetical protein